MFKFIVNFKLMATKKSSPEEVTSEKKTSTTKKAKKAKKVPLKKAGLKPVIPSSKKT
jgi:hypothetical protein